MPHVLFVAPHFPANQRRFVQGLKNVGAQVTGLGDAPRHEVDPEVLDLLDGYEPVSNVTDPQALLEAVRRVQDRGPWVDRLEATIESHMLPTARVREATGIPGLPADQVLLCRDKFLMKQFLRERGIPCADHAEVHTAGDARTFVARSGYPVILKPRDGAGALATYRVDDDDGLTQALHETGLLHGRGSFAIESFVEGHEGFYDTLTCGGEVVFEGVTHYYPNVLEAMRTRWISPQMISHQSPERRQLWGAAALWAQGDPMRWASRTTATHMEWFFGPRGLSFSEIGARPPGCNHWDLYCAANEFDLYTEWARGPRVGRHPPRAVTSVQRGPYQPSAQPRWHDRGLFRARRHPGSSGRAHPGSPPASAGHPHATGGRGLPRQRVDPRAPSRL